METENKEFLVTEIEKYDELKFSKSEKALLILSIISIGISALAILVIALRDNELSYIHLSTGISGVLGAKVAYLQNTKRNNEENKYMRL